MPAVPAARRRTITARQIAERIGVNKRTILNWASRGTFPAPLACSPYKLLFDAAEVERFLAERRVPQGSGR
jgi:predicted DNA-binding transcriptional regulator AlpA